MALLLLREQRWQRRGVIGGGSGSSTTTVRRRVFDPPRSSSSAEIDAALELFLDVPAVDARKTWRLDQGPQRGRGLFATAPLARNDAALHLPASGLLAVPLSPASEDDDETAALELYKRYLDAWERGNGGRIVPPELRRLLLRPLRGSSKEEDDENDPEQQQLIGPAARLAAFLLWAVGDGNADDRWRRYASSVLPRPPPSLVGAPSPSSPAQQPWLPDPQSMLLDAYPGELEAAAAAGAGDLAEKALRMRAQAAEAVGAARRALRAGEEDEDQWWWALDMAKSRAFALSCGPLRVAVLAPVADLLNHDDDENQGAACACRLDNDGPANPFSLVVAARRGVQPGEELTLDYTAGGSSSGLDSAALAAGYRFVPQGGCVGDRLPRQRAAAVLLLGEGGGDGRFAAAPPPLTPALRRALARAADALAEDQTAPRHARRRAHRALASLLEAWGGGGGEEAVAPGTAAAAAAETLSPAVAAFLRERELLEEAAKEVLRRVEEC